MQILKRFDFRSLDSFLRQPVQTFKHTWELHIIITAHC